MGYKYGEYPLWTILITIPVLVIVLIVMYAHEIFFLWPKKHCPRCRLWTSVNSGKFCNICLKTYEEAT